MKLKPLLIGSIIIGAYPWGGAIITHALGLWDYAAIEIASALTFPMVCLNIAFASGTINWLFNKVTKI